MTNLTKHQWVRQSAGHYYWSNGCYSITREDDFWWLWANGVRIDYDKTLKAVKALVTRNY